MLNKILEVFIKAWLCVVLVIALMSLAGWIGSWPGIRNILGSAYPFSVSWMTILVLLLPAIVANIWLERRRGHGIR